jgi:putative hydrolase of the HAD superfamily
MCGTPDIRVGCAKMLADLYKQGFKLGIISNTTSFTNVVIRLFKNKIYQYFDEDSIFLSCSSQYRKPGTEIFKAAADTIGFKTSEVAYVGDRISKDVVGSRDAKYGASIRILPEKYSEMEEGQEKNDTKYLIKSLSELAPLLKQINKPSKVKK